MTDKKNEPPDGCTILFVIVSYTLIFSSLLWLGKNVADRIKALEEKVEKLESVITKEKQQ